VTWVVVVVRSLPTASFRGMLSMRNKATIVRRIIRTIDERLIETPHTETHQSWKSRLLRIAGRFWVSYIVFRGAAMLRKISRHQMKSPHA
jgi:hypothetical protein